MKEKSEEEKILLSLKNGNLAAFEKILLLYEDRIFNYIYHLVGQKQDAEDLTQETFIKLYTHIKTIDINKNFLVWLYKIATNTVYDFWRRKKNKKEILLDELQNLETIETETTYLNIEKQEVVRDVQNALAKIKPIYRTVLLLFYKNNFTYKEIAETLNLPLNTVKIYIHRAKKELKEKLKNGKTY